MEGVPLSKRLGEIMNMLFDIWNEVNHYGEDTQTRTQELRSMLQTVIEWCDEEAQIFVVHPPFLLVGMRTDVPILAPPGQATFFHHSGSTFDRQ